MQAIVLGNVRSTNKSRRMRATNSQESEYRNNDDDPCHAQHHHHHHRPNDQWI
jgi:hypothetical protein